MNELTISTPTAQALTVWAESDKIRKIFAPTLNEQEFQFFMGLGKSLGANPFTREIWAVKYEGGKPASVFCGRDFYRRKAQEQPGYKGHIVEVIYTNDELLIENGMVTRHVPNLKDPGQIFGAYCIVFMEGKTPYVSRVRMNEYNKGFSNWKTMPETMIKKVAEAQGLRGAYQGIFAGTYGEGEEWEQEKKVDSCVKVTIEPTNVSRASDYITPEPIVEPGGANAVVEPSAKVWKAEEMRAVLDQEAGLMIKIMNLSLGQVRELFKKHEGKPEVIKDALSQLLTPEQAQQFVDRMGEIE